LAIGSKIVWHPMLGAWVSIALWSHGITTTGEFALSPILSKEIGPNMMQKT
jgi:hypothetical protein